MSHVATNTHHNTQSALNSHAVIAALPLVGRVLISAIYILSGLSKLGAPAATIGYISSTGLPFASLGLAVAIVTEWNQFRALDLPRLKTLLKAPVLVDLRNIYRPDEVTRHGFVYSSVGRPN